MSEPGTVPTPQTVPTSRRAAAPMRRPRDGNSSGLRAASARGRALSVASTVAGGLSPGANAAPRAGSSRVQKWEAFVVIAVNMLTSARTILLAAMVLMTTAIGPARAVAPQRDYKSADDAVAALVQALQKADTASVGRILGPGSEGLVRSGDPVKDRTERQKFLDAYTAHHSLEADGADRMVLH